MLVRIQAAMIGLWCSGPNLIECLKERSLVQVWINYRTGQAIHRRRQPAENGLVKPGSKIATGGPRPCSDVKLVVTDRLFFGPPAQLEPPQTIVFERRSSEMQCFGAILHKKSDSFPQSHVVGPEFLEPLIGSTEFINGLFPNVEEDRCSNAAGSAACDYNETESRFDYLIVDV